MRQLQHGRQTKSHQQRQAHGQAHQCRLQCGPGQIGIDQTGQQLDKTQVHAITGQHPQHTGHQTCTQKLQAITQCECALALTHHPKQSAGIELSLGKTARRQSHSHGAHQGGQQSHQIQKLRGPVQGLTHLGPAAVERLDLHATHIGLVDLGLRPRQKLPYSRIAAGHGHAPADAAGRLDQPGGGQIGHVHHDARGKGHETRTPIGLAGDGGANAQTPIAQAEHLSHLDIQGFEQGRIDPDLTRWWDAGAALTRNLQPTAQGVTRLHGFEGHQTGGRGGAGVRGGHGTRHGRETHIGVALQTGCLGLLHKGLGGALVAHHHSVAPQQLACITPQARLHAVGQKTDRRQSRNRQRHRHHQQAQLASPQISPQLASTELQTMHPGLLVHEWTLPQWRRSDRGRDLHIG